MASVEAMLHPLETLKVHGGGGTGVLSALGEDVGGAMTLLDSYILTAAPRARLTEEQRLEREVARRREQDLERRARIFDAKRRTIGVDKEALDAQVLEREQRRELEKQQRHAGDTDLLVIDRHLKQAEAEKRRVRREAERECREYSSKYLNKESASTFDLNDKAALRKCAPARFGDDDPRCGPASMQKFNGEDLYRAERIKQQQRQMADFIEQQKFEKVIMSSGGRAEDIRHAKEVTNIIEMRNMLEEMELKERKDIQKSYQDDNIVSAAAAAKQRVEQQREHMESNASELEFNAHDPFLNETGETRDAHGRPCRTEYKGSTRQERLQARLVLEEQEVEQQAARLEELLDDRRHAAFMEVSRRQMMLQEREKQRMRRATAEKVARQNYDVLRTEHLDSTRLANQLYTNKVAEEFYNQFGTSSR